MSAPLSTLLAELHDLGLTSAQRARVRRVLDVIEGEGGVSPDDLAACREMMVPPEPGPPPEQSPLVSHAPYRRGGVWVIPETAEAPPEE